MESIKRSQKRKVIIEICLEKFSFLVSEYGFKVVIKKGIDDIEVIFQNGTTGVQILFDQRENQFYVMVFQLINGMFIDNPIFIGSDTKIYGYDLNDILSLRIPNYKGIEMRSNLEGVRSMLDHYARMLRLYAPDILLGDFTLFPMLAKIVKSRK